MGRGTREAPRGTARPGQHGESLELSGQAPQGSEGWRAARASEARPCPRSSRLNAGEKLHSGDSRCRKKSLGG